MEPLSFLSLVLSIPVFAIFSFFAFFVPGFILVSTITRPRHSASMLIVLSSALSIVLWGVQGYVFGLLGIRWATYVLLIVYIGLGIRWHNQFYKLMRVVGVRIRQVDKLVVFIVVLGILLQSAQMVGSGIVSREGMRFYRVHGQDGIYHLALIQSIVRQFPPIEPGAANTPVANYHYWSDLVIAETSRATRIPPHTLFFQLIPVLISILTVLALLTLTRLCVAPTYWRLVSVFILFLHFFGADSMYIPSLVLRGNWGFQLPAIDNGVTQFLNMPHAMASCLFFSGLVGFIAWMRAKYIGNGVIAILLLATLVGFKVYFGLFAAIGLLSVGFSQVLLWIVRRKERGTRGKFLLSYVALGIVGMIIALLIYLPPNRNAGGLGWYPLEWPKLLINEFHLDFKELRYRQAIALYYHDWFKLAVYNAIAVVITLIGIHGVRLLGFFPGKAVRMFGGWEFFAFSFPATLLFTFLGFTTLQKSGGAAGAFNVFNFFAMSMAVLSLYSAVLLASWWHTKVVLVRILIVGICLLTLPRIGYESWLILDSYWNNHNSITILTGEMEAMAFVAKSSPVDDVVVSYPRNELDFQTPYVSYFTNRQSYVSGVGVLETHNQPTTEQEKEMRDLFSHQNGQTLIDRLREHNIDIIYCVRKQFDDCKRSLASNLILYQNTEAIVYGVK